MQVDASGSLNFIILTGRHQRFETDNVWRLLHVVVCVLYLRFSLAPFHFLCIFTSHRHLVQYFSASFDPPLSPESLPANDATEAMADSLAQAWREYGDER